MLITRSALALTATFMLGPFIGMPGYAADLTIANVREVSQKGAKRDRPEAAKGPNSAQISANSGKRAEKKQRKNITTYNLLANPAFKHGTGVSGKARFGAANGMGLGTGIDYIPPHSTPPVQPNGVSNTPFSSGYKGDLDKTVKTASNNTPSASADCREKFSSVGPNRRDMTACFVHQLDRSWKTQTYVSRRSADGNNAWGGGLAVGYDY
jgi:hypothetical protein